MSRVLYGWRISCNEPGCKAVAEKFSSYGIPSLDLTPKGWFIHSEARGVRYAYCPAHAAIPLAWWASFVQWNTDRRHAYERGAKAGASRLARLMLPTLTGELDHLSGERAVREWVAANPKPLPPWRKRP